MILLGLGSNLPSTFGDRFKNIELAIDALNGYGIMVKKQSSYYESLSYPNKTEPKFINVVIEVESDLPPVDLASVLIFIEQSLERKRQKKNEPRTCDIDIIDYKNQVLVFKYQNQEFKVPHTSLTKRNFVLYPLHEIFPHWRHPETKELITSLLDKLSNEDKNSILKIQKP